MPITKKQKLYELDPRFFKDHTGNGIGDLKGLASKVEYFKFLGVDGVILQNTLAADSDDAVQNFTQIAKDLGNINDLKVVISKAKSQGIKIILELGIGSIRESHRWFTNAESQSQEGFKDIVDFVPKKDESTQEFKYSSETKKYYPVDSKTQEVPLNWKSEQVMDQFMKVIRFWTEQGIDGFVFKDFEFLASPEKTESMSDETLKELRKFYRAIKEINDDIIVIGKSALLPISHTNTYTDGSTKVFDYFMSQVISLIGTSSKFGNDQAGKFKASTLAGDIKKYVKDQSNILTFGSNLTGRVNSRWGNHGQFSNESAKALGMALMLTPGSSSIYYGDEIGALNIGLTHLDDFQDLTLTERMKELVVKHKLKEKDILDAQVLQAAINSRSLMAWDEGKNGGFSIAEKTITPVSSTYKEINVKNQFADMASTLSFFKELHRIVGTSSFAPVIAKGKFHISSMIPGVIKMTSKLNDKEVRIYINLTDKVKKIRKSKGGRVILSTHGHKTYKDLPTSLEAYEGIMISKHTDEAIKMTVQIKAQETKAKEAAKKVEAAEVIRLEQENVRIAEEKAAAREKAAREKIAAQQSEQQAIIDAKVAKETAAKAKADEKESALKAAVIAQEKQEAAAEKTRLIEVKHAEKEAARVAREEIKEQKQIEKTRAFELKQKEKAEAVKAKLAQQEQENKQKLEANANKVQEDSELAATKAAIKAEKEAAKQLFKDEQKFDIMNEEVLESDRTTLREDEIAPTTQIDIDAIDDFEAFLNSDKKRK